MKRVRHRPTSCKKAYVIRRQDGLNCPWAQCDECKQLVHQFDAGVAWSPRPYRRTVKGVKILCKTQGCLSLPKYRMWNWMELREFVAHLRYNLKLGA